MTDIVDRLRREVVWESEVGDVLNAAADEIEQLRLAIRRLADQDATLSVQGGSVIVDIECQDLLQKNLTAEERVAISAAVRIVETHDEEMDGFPSGAAYHLRKLLERLK